jgi:hypothetical protein
LFLRRRRLRRCPCDCPGPLAGAGPTSIWGCVESVVMRVLPGCMLFAALVWVVLPLGQAACFHAAGSISSRLSRPTRAELRRNLAQSQFSIPGFLLRSSAPLRSPCTLISQNVLISGRLAPTPVTAQNPRSIPNGSVNLGCDPVRSAIPRALLFLWESPPPLPYHLEIAAEGSCSATSALCPVGVARVSR